MEKETIFPVRKNTRIPHYNYATCNYYFVTICTHNKTCIFGKPGQLNQFGMISYECIELISKFYPNVQIDKFVVMPNHIHMIVVIGAKEKQAKLPNLSHVIGQYKMAVTKKIRLLKPDLIVWQRSFHDHIIRNQKSFEKIWLYIENNPVKWEDDCFYSE